MGWLAVQVRGVLTLVLAALVSSAADGGVAMSRSHPLPCATLPAAISAAPLTPTSTLHPQFGNPHSRTHMYGWESEDAVEKARQQVGLQVHSARSRTWAGPAWLCFPRSLRPQLVFRTAGWE